MKKLFFLLLTIMAFIGIVKADEYYFDYRTKTAYAEVTTNIQFKDGFVFTDSDYVSRKEKVYLSYYDIEGKLIKSNTLEDRRILQIVTDNNYLYALGGKYSNIGHSYAIYKIDENLNVVKEAILDNYSYVFDDQTYSGNEKWAGLKTIKIENGKVKILSVNPGQGNGEILFNVITLDTDLNNQTLKPLSETNDFEEVKISLNKIDPTLQDDEDTYYFGEPAMLGENVLFSFGRYGVCEQNNIINHNDNQPQLLMLADDCERYATLTLYDKNGQVKWTKDFKNYYTIDNIRVNSKHIVALAREYEKNSYEEEASIDIIIMDHNGNILQTIERKTGYGRLELDEDSLTFTSFNYEMCQEAFPYDDPGCTAKVQHEVYLMEYKIETKVTKGKGTVEAIKSSRPGAPVTFVVTPEEGYVLGEVRVTDANGKTVIFKQNTFTMPSADVTIEAVFLPANPETKDLAIALLIMLSIITLVITLIEGKKLKNLGV